jgi:hypothetical protein
MSGNLGEITVNANYEQDFVNWNECFNSYGYSSNQAFAFALAYLYSDDVFWDLNNSLAWLSKEDCIKRMRQASSMFDNIPRGLLDAGSILTGYNRSSPDAPYAMPTSGINATYWGTFKAAAHWLWGNGSPTRIDIKELNIQLSVDRIGRTSLPLINVIAESVKPGAYPYDSGPYGYETYADDQLPPKLIVGGIVLNTIGMLTRNENGTYEFSGKTSALNDTFNMDQRPGRPWWADVVVDMFNSIGGSDYTIAIDGVIENHLQGK